MNREGIERGKLGVTDPIYSRPVSTSTPALIQSPATSSLSPARSIRHPWSNCTPHSPRIHTPAEKSRVASMASPRNAPVRLSTGPGAGGGTRHQSVLGRARRERWLPSSEMVWDRAGGLRAKAGSLKDDWIEAISRVRNWTFGYVSRSKWWPLGAEENRDSAGTVSEGSRVDSTPARRLQLGRRVNRRLERMLMTMKGRRSTGAPGWWS
jgi:hypothetical protein